MFNGYGTLNLLALFLEIDILIPELDYCTRGGRYVASRGPGVDALIPELDYCTAEIMFDQSRGELRKM